MKIVQTHPKKWQKMKSKAVVLIFGKSLNYKSGLGFFVPALEVPFFEVQTRAFLAKVAILRGQKMALPVSVQKIRHHFYNSNFPWKWGLWPLISFFVTFEWDFDDFHFRALLAFILEGKSDQNEKCNFAK